ncbi:hypothetical protein PAMP_011921 [Pampus punctatissimus]
METANGNHLPPSTLHPPTPSALLPQCMSHNMAATVSVGWQQRLWEKGFLVKSNHLQTAK